MLDRGTTQYEVLMIMRKNKKYRLVTLAEMHAKKSMFSGVTLATSISGSWVYEETRSALRRLVAKGYVERPATGIYVRVK